MKPEKTFSRNTVRQVAIQVAEKARRKHRKHALKVLAEKSKKQKLMGKSNMMSGNLEDEGTANKRKEETHIILGAVRKFLDSFSQ